MPKRKKFFSERTVAQISRMGPERIYKPRGLVEKLDSSDISSDAYVLHFPVLPAGPGGFYHQANWEGATDADDSLLCLKYGDYIKIGQPETIKDAKIEKDSPLKIRSKSIRHTLDNLCEEEIFFLGIKFRPLRLRHKDSMWRVVPLVAEVLGTKIFTYAENYTGGIDFLGDQLYINAKGVDWGGLTAVAVVPSMTRKARAYKIRLGGIPFYPNPGRMAVAWGLTPSFLTDDDRGRGEPGNLLWKNIRQPFPQSNREKRVIEIDPHIKAAHLGVIAKSWREYHQTTPFETSPLAFISQRFARLYEFIRNNLLIIDSRTKKPRKLHQAETSILLMRAVKALGHNETLYLDFNPIGDGRDPKIKDFAWFVPDVAQEDARVRLLEK